MFSTQQAFLLLLTFSPVVYPSEILINWYPYKISNQLAASSSIYKRQQQIRATTSQRRLHTVMVEIDDRDMHTSVDACIKTINTLDELVSVYKYDTHLLDRAFSYNTAKIFEKPTGSPYADGGHYRDMQDVFKMLEKIGIPRYKPLSQALFHLVALDLQANARDVVPKELELDYDMLNAHFVSITGQWLKTHKLQDEHHIPKSIELIITRASADDDFFTSLAAAKQLTHHVDATTGATSLIQAAAKGYQGIVALLIRQKADLFAKDQADNTAFDTAIRHQQPHIALMLLDAGSPTDHICPKIMATLRQLDDEIMKHAKAIAYQLHNTHIANHLERAKRKHMLQNLTAHIELVRGLFYDYRMLTTRLAVTLAGQASWNETQTIIGFIEQSLAKFSDIERELRAV